MESHHVIPVHRWQISRAQPVRNNRARCLCHGCKDHHVASWLPGISKIASTTPSTRRTQHSRWSYSLLFCRASQRRSQPQERSSYYYTAPTGSTPRSQDSSDRGKGALSEDTWLKRIGDHSLGCRNLGGGYMSIALGWHHRCQSVSVWSLNMHAQTRLSF